MKSSKSTSTRGSKKKKSRSTANKSVKKKVASSRPQYSEAFRRKVVQFSVKNGIVTAAEKFEGLAFCIRDATIHHVYTTGVTKK